jgi:transcriptional regulator with XRE-family HTH domain
MTPEEFRAARYALGLSVPQLAELIGLKPTQIYRLEMQPGLATSRAVTPTLERLMQALLDGWRPTRPR